MILTFYYPVTVRILTVAHDFFQSSNSATAGSYDLCFLPLMFVVGIVELCFCSTRFAFVVFIMEEFQH